MERVWVECMYNTNGASCVLTVGKQYYATVINEYTYRMKNDKGELDWFSKDRFKIITDNNEIWVECIDESSPYGKDLTIGKVYKVKEVPSDKNCYVVQNDNGKESYHSKIKFKPVNKTPILTPIKWDGVNDIDTLINVIYHIIIKCKSNIIRFILHGKINLDTYTFELNNNKLAIDKFNEYISKFNLKIELEQPKFKINCEKLYTKEEADKLKESGIDLVEVKE